MGRSGVRESRRNASTQGFENKSLKGGFWIELSRIRRRNKPRNSPRESRAQVLDKHICRSRGRLVKFAEMASQQIDARTLRLARARKDERKVEAEPAKAFFWQDTDQLANNSRLSDACASTDEQHVEVWPNKSFSQRIEHPLSATECDGFAISGEELIRNETRKDTRHKLLNFSIN